MSENEAYLVDILIAMQDRLERDLLLLDTLIWMWCFHKAGMPI